MATLKALRKEIEDLHVFFEDWFSGRSSSDEFAARFDHRFDEQTLLIQPGGAALPLDQFKEGLRAAHGSNPDFRIQIRNVTLRREFGELALVTYEEWQRNALASRPPDNARVSSVLFDTSGETLTWLHIHETWLPEDQVTSDRFDF